MRDIVSELRAAADSERLRLLDAAIDDAKKAPEGKPPVGFLLSLRNAQANHFPNGKSR